MNKSKKPNNPIKLSQQVDDEFQQIFGQVLDEHLEKTKSEIKEIVASEIERIQGKPLKKSR